MKNNSIPLFKVYMNDDIDIVINSKDLNNFKGGKLQWSKKQKRNTVPVPVLYGYGTYNVAVAPASCM